MKGKNVSIQNKEIHDFYYFKCRCGKKREAYVMMTRGIDRRYYFGSCISCGKKIIEREKDGKRI